MNTHPVASGINKSYVNRAGVSGGGHIPYPVITDTEQHHSASDTTIVRHYSSICVYIQAFTQFCTNPLTHPPTQRFREALRMFDAKSFQTRAPEFPCKALQGFSTTGAEAKMSPI